MHQEGGGYTTNTVFEIYFFYLGWPKVDVNNINILTELSQKVIK